MRFDKTEQGSTESTLILHQTASLPLVRITRRRTLAPGHRLQVGERVLHARPLGVEARWAQLAPAIENNGGPGSAPSVGTSPSHRAAPYRRCRTRSAAMAFRIEDNLRRDMR